ncbi:MAG: virulence protein [Bryobacterales bacterium]|nr:virulence protein [Bryobacterales bacterium]
MMSGSRSPLDGTISMSCWSRIRSIRASEKRFYQKVRDLFATSADYDGKDQNAQVFFKTIQNKMIFAVTGRLRLS